MAKYVAFLRAINVGGHGVVKMDALRSMFENAGLENVKTVIASGNVIFDSASTKSAAAKLIAGIGFTAFVRTIAEVKRIAEYSPFKDAAEHDLHIAILEKKPSAEGVKKLLALTNPIDAFHVDGAEMYWLRRRTLGESKVAGNWLEKSLGVQATVRNVKTIRRIAAM